MLQRPGIVPSGSQQIPQSWFERLDAYLAALTWRPSKDFLPTMGPGGTTGSVRQNAATLAAAIVAPFRVIAGPVNSDGFPLIGVVADSHIIDSSDKDSYELDNTSWGLLTADHPDDDPGWFICPEIGSKIFLQVEYNQAGDIVGGSVQYGQVGNDNLWTDFPDEVSINTDGDKPWQQFLFIPIAEITDPEADPRPGFNLLLDGEQVQVAQLLTTNLKLVDARTAESADQPNIGITVAIPYSAPSTGTNGDGEGIYSGVDDVKTPWVFGRPDTSRHPFQVLDATDNDGTKASVYYFSDLWTAYGTKQPITGLDEAHAVAVGDVIYLAIKIKAQYDVSVDSAEVRWGSVWDGGPSNPIGSTPDSNGYPYQTYYYHLIAEVTDPETEERPGIEIGKPGQRVKIVQHANSAILCNIQVVSGFPAVVIIPCSL